MTDVPASPPSPEGAVPEGTASPPARARSISTESGDFPVVETTLDPTRMPLLRFLLKLPLKKLTIWGACVLLLVLLWDFFPLIFMTFVLSYIATSVVGRVEGRFKHRALPVSVFFSCVVALVVGFALLTVPQITAKARELRAEISSPKHRGVNAWLDSLLKQGLGDDLYAKALDEFGATPVPRQTRDEALKAALEKLETRPQTEWEPILQELARHSAEPDTAEARGEKSLSAGLYDQISHEQRAEYMKKLGAAGRAAWTGVVYVFLSILFSFMFVLGLPKFRRGLEKLERSRLADVYKEVAPSIAQFGRLLGRAFEAQTIIAACNTTVTFVGMKLIGIPYTLPLSIVVFVCSFIPVAGVFISTTPIALVALVMPGGGLKAVAFVILMVMFAHILEAYVLNPRIYGHHMKMNTLAVLVILVVAEHTVGVWGLVIAIPLATYVWRYLVLGEDDEPPRRTPKLPARADVTIVAGAAADPAAAPAPAVPSFAVPSFGQPQALAGTGAPAPRSGTERR